jgi:hypothetical protein
VLFSSKFPLPPISSRGVLLGVYLFRRVYLDGGGAPTLGTAVSSPYKFDREALAKGRRRAPSIRLPLPMVGQSQMARCLLAYLLAAVAIGHPVSLNRIVS